MEEFFALLSTVLLIGLSAFQFALAQGAPLGKLAWGGQHIVLPHNLRIASGVSIIIYFIFIVVILQEAGLIDVVDPNKTGFAIWIITAYLFIGIFLNAISRSKWERYIMTPITAELFISFLIVAT